MELDMMLRLLLSVVFGGAIGYVREKGKRPDCAPIYLSALAPRYSR